MPERRRYTKRQKMTAVIAADMTSVLGASEAMGICEPVRRVYIEEALRRLWSKYSIEPPARSVRTSEAA